ncbi:hypothetical protein G7L40_23925 [Paenibacillus polymyxa]|uniref:Uncharacterized protein n=1 Tax=Paenibacillus polymyxa TaxID=1406 RepID=A0A378XZI2_PAEPO|nr:hypothetical protein [Paenibacillus polymyxa]MBE7897967.1 hypothetical protein [Paenibacillus polymyxa]MBG9763154.1 hypothetical protein [Paenibacillus polymyxa]MCC3257794.1 hypothetical protein [Paenibacillus polymyxa]QPK55461.1 hypothetical protein G7035_24010 [Paenibacillus polymyxa]QPK60549.1 hypothetical protein G7L40_23925 [Paenibacillus polymyxa]
MTRNLQYVPYGYEPPIETHKGTMVYYDTFEQTTASELELFAETGAALSFTKLVLYPLHEETVRRMWKLPVRSYYKRVDELGEWQREQALSAVVIENWEGKRKKYTPIEAAIRFLAEKYATPLFLYMSPETANLCASYASFGEWIRNVRLVLSSEPLELHPKLVQYRNRWNTVKEATNHDSKVDKEEHEL